MSRRHRRTPKRYRTGVIERGGEQPPNPPAPPKTQSEPPKASAVNLFELGEPMWTTREDVTVSYEPPANTVGVWLNTTDNDQTRGAFLGYFGLDQLDGVWESLKAPHALHEGVSKVTDASFFADVDTGVAGYEISYETEG